MYICVYVSDCMYMYACVVVYMLVFANLKCQPLPFVLLLLHNRSNAEGRG